MKRDTLTAILPDGRQHRFDDREAWALRHLHTAGSAGLTTLEQPAPRWPHYIFKLGRAGICITTETEIHGGTYSGHHGRYRLITPLLIVEEDAA